MQWVGWPNHRILWSFHIHVIYSIYGCTMARSIGLCTFMYSLSLGPREYIQVPSATNPIHPSYPWYNYNLNHHFCAWNTPGVYKYHLLSTKQLFKYHHYPWKHQYHHLCHERQVFINTTSYIHETHQVFIITWCFMHKSSGIYKYLVFHAQKQ